MIIYKITNKVNGKIYIGQDSKNDPDYYGSGTNIKRAIQKYGLHNFTKEVLEEVSEDTLDDRETYWINELQSYKADIGYNINREGGKPPKLANLPLDQQQLIKQKWSQQRKGKSHSKEYRANHSKIMKEYYKDKEHPTKGRKASNAEKLKKSENAKKQGLGGNYWESYSEEKKEQIKEKMSASKKGRKLSEETKKKISQTLKNRKR